MGNTSETATIFALPRTHHDSIHGTIGYGVFTYALAKEFRKAEAARETDVSFTNLIERVNATMKTLRYDQISDVKGPKQVCNGPVLGLPPKKRSR
jgi:hypothetical protein